MVPILNSCTANERLWVQRQLRQISPEDWDEFMAGLRPSMRLCLDRIMSEHDHGGALERLDLDHPSLQAIDGRDRKEIATEDSAEEQELQERDAMSQPDVAT